MEREVIIESLECISFDGLAYTIKGCSNCCYYGGLLFANDAIFGKLNIKDKCAFQREMLSLPSAREGVWPYGDREQTIRLMVALINYACVNGFIDKIKVAKTDGLLKDLKHYGLLVPAFAHTLTDSDEGYDMFTRGHQFTSDHHTVGGLLAQVKEHCSGKSQEDTQLHINVRHRNIKFNFNN